ncbi:hypothetical protein FRAHR75_10004 [Frankia sp. Hr75.2]|nr:hypothetical protein FRAHR75_10004 [Frankia sp. Hr75.2]SQD99376.1 hypothetical protein FMEAI12_5260016 [Parafrankia sp. Ea1.12]
MQRRRRAAGRTLSQGAPSVWRVTFATGEQRLRGPLGHGVHPGGTLGTHETFILEAVDPTERVREAGGGQSSAGDREVPVRLRQGHADRRCPRAGARRRAAHSE